MGLTFSATSNEQYSKVVNDTILNTIISFSDSCGASSNTKQSISLKKGKFGAIINSLNQRANVSINLQCLQNSVTQQELEDRLQSAIKQAVESQSTPAPTLLGLKLDASVNVSKAVSEQINRVARTVSVDNIKTCLSQLNVDQELTFGDLGPVEIDALINSGNQIVTTDVIAKCVQSNNVTQKAVLDLTNELNQDSKYRFGLDVWGIAGIVLTIVFVCCCLSIVSSLLAAMNNGQQGSRAPSSGKASSTNGSQNGLAGVANQVLANALTNAMYKPGVVALAAPAVAGPALGAALGGPAGAGAAAAVTKMI